MKHAALALSFICAITFAIRAADDPLDDVPLNKAVNEKLKKPISVDVNAQPFKGALKTVSDATGVRIFIDPRLKSREATPVTLHADAMPAEKVLRELVKQLRLEFDIRQGVVFIVEFLAPGGPVVKTGPPAFLVPDANEPRWKTELRDQLNRKNITFEFIDEPFDAAIAKVAEISQVKIRVLPRPGEAKAKVSLRVTDMPLSTTLQWLAALQDYDVQLKESGVEIAKAKQ